MRRIFVIIIAISLLLAASATAFAAPQPGGGFAVPKISIGIGGSDDPADVSTSIKLLLFFSVLALLPSILIMLTSFTRIVVVLGFMRQAMGTHQAPNNQIIIELALFLTFFIMQPVFTQVKTTALDPYLDQQVNHEEAAKLAIKPIRTFMLAQVNEKDLALFAKAARIAKPATPDDLPIHIVIPAFLTSELRTAFMIGFLIYLPFLVIDMIVASILMSMGMMMLPPIMISLPFKLMVFVLADGWYLIVGSLVRSFVV